jgi:hypothetical protein
MKVGHESVVIGQVAAGATIGDRSVVIGATDSNGNTVIREGAYGYGAKARPGAVAIGAHANAASHENGDIEVLRGLVEALSLALERSGKQGELAEELRTEVEALKTQASSPKPKWEVISSTGCSIKKVIEGAAGNILGDLAKPYVLPILALAASYVR